MTEEKIESDSGSTKENNVKKEIEAAKEQTAPSKPEEDVESTTEKVDQNVKDGKENKGGEKVKKGVPLRKIGRCFESTSMKLGQGSTSKVQKDVEIHYYIELLEDGSIVLEMVDQDGEPTGNLLEEISKEGFSKRFKTCSQHDCPLRISTLDEIRKRMAANRAKMGEQHLKDGELDKAKDKFKRALKFDEENVRARFGLGKTHMKEGKIEEATKIFKELSEMDALFEEENKHVFNKFGIELRKSKMYDLAIANYEKAILIDSKDEALYYNLSIAYEKKDLIQKAIEKLKEALEIDKNFPEAQKRLELLFVKEQKTLDSLLKKSG